jgi:hypothetical protein
MLQKVVKNTQKICINEMRADLPVVMLQIRSHFESGQICDASNFTTPPAGLRI